MISAKTTIGELLDLSEGVEEVFLWYGIELENGDEDLSLEELARDYGIDVLDLLIDLREVVYGEEEEDDENEDDWDEALEWEPIRKTGPRMRE